MPQDEIKDFLRPRPIYHYSTQRVKGHLMVCVFAYLVEKVLEKSLKRANLSFTPREALDYLDTLRLVENKIAGQHLFV
jgi:transposase